MEMEMKDELGSTVERLAAAAGLLEQAVERLAQRQNDFALDAEASIGRIVATVEGRRETELEEKLAAAEAQIAELKAAAAASMPTSVTHGRKTLPVAMVNLLAKQGVTVGSMEAGALDAALVNLSVEQRIAVKAQLMRSGLLG
jgi:F0F1-type ATP synthase membrane subunit b/b'